MPPIHARNIKAIYHEFVAACREVFGGTLIAIIAKGSAVKGGFIPGLSDVDLHVYLSPDAFLFNDFVRLDLALQLQVAMNRLLQGYDVGGGPIQVVLLNVACPRDWSGPIEGTYRLLYGESCPEAAPVAEEMLQQDLQNLELNAFGFRTANSLIDKTLDTLPNYVRRLNTAVNPTLFRVLSLLTRDSLRVWALTKWEVLQELARLEREDAREFARLGQRFYELAAQSTWLRADPEHCRQVLYLGYRILMLGRQLAAELNESQSLSRRCFT